MQFLATEARRMASEGVRLHVRRNGFRLAGALLFFNNLFQPYSLLPQELDEIFHLGNLLWRQFLDSFDQQLCLHSSYSFSQMMPDF
jgi:hypothetical protein